jgi:hypothetical protein
VDGLKSKGIEVLDSNEFDDGVSEFRKREELDIYWEKINIVRRRVANEIHFLIDMQSDWREFVSQSITSE